MRLSKLSLRGITAFDQADVDFAALGEGLVAIAGANGAGKTTLLEAPFAALYLEYPTRPGSLYGVAHGRDAKIEVELEDGDHYRCLAAVDAIGQKTEAYLFGGDGQPITNGKVREYSAEIERRFGSARLMLSAALSCQTKRGSFLDLSKAERKDLLAEILDTAGLQRLSEAAHAKVKAGELQFERMRGQVAEAEAELGRLAAAPAEDLQVERARLEAVIATAQADLETARERHAELQTQHALALEAERQRDAKEEARDGLDFDIGTVKAKLAALPVDQAHARECAQAGILEAEGQAERLPEYKAAADALPAARERRTEAQRDLRERNVELREARETLLVKVKGTAKGAEIRACLAAATRQAGLLSEVPCTAARAWVPPGFGPPEITGTDLAGTCPLLADARSAKTEISELERQLIELEALEAALPEHQRASDEAEVRVTMMQAGLDEAQAEAERLEPLAAAVGPAQAAVKRAVEIRQQLDESLAALSEREAEFREQVDALVNKRTVIVNELEGTEAVDSAGVKAEMDLVQRQVLELRADVDERQTDLQALLQAIATAEAEAKRRAELEQRVRENRAAAEKLAGDLGEWGLLERAFGRDGIQALEIDAAGPELSSLTNELLTSCFGPRFELRFVTQIPKASEKGAMKEVFDVQVIDHDRGREGAVDSLSGGEKTIVSEAISLALAIYVGRHSGRRYETLFRDETAGQLDPENAQRYVAMLRRARVMAGAHQVVFIAQQPEVWQAADAVLYVQGGQVEVRA